MIMLLKKDIRGANIALPMIYVTAAIITAISLIDKHCCPKSLGKSKQNLIPLGFVRSELNSRFEEYGTNY